MKCEACGAPVSVKVFCGSPRYDDDHLIELEKENVQLHNILDKLCKHTSITLKFNNGLRFPIIHNPELKQDNWDEIMDELDKKS